MIASRSIVAVHPASQNCPTDRRLPDPMSGKMCVSLASSGIPGMSSCAVWLDLMISLFGIWMLMGFVAFFTLMTGAVAMASAVKKLPVLPVSIMAEQGM